jgi:hypothetical protein
LRPGALIDIEMDALVEAFQSIEADSPTKSEMVAMKNAIYFLYAKFPIF